MLPAISVAICLSKFKSSCIILEPMWAWGWSGSTVVDVSLSLVSPRTCFVPFNPPPSLNSSYLTTEDKILTKFLYKSSVNRGTCTVKKLYAGTVYILVTWIVYIHSFADLNIQKISMQYKHLTRWNSTLQLHDRKIWREAHNQVHGSSEHIGIKRQDVFIDYSTGIIW